MFGKVVIARNESRWNTQLKMVRRLMELIQKELYRRKGFSYINAYYEKVVFEGYCGRGFAPFEDSTDILQEDNTIQSP